jgi:hypothetical protein
MGSPLLILTAMHPSGNLLLLPDVVCSDNLRTVLHNQNNEIFEVTTI